LFVAGGTVTISSPVGQHLRVAGGNVAVDGSVQQDLLAAAGTLTVGSAARIGGDVIFTAGSAALDGTVAGSVLGSAGTYTKGGSIAGSDEVTVREGRLEEAREPSAADRVLHELRRYLGIVLIGALLLWLAPPLIQPAAVWVRERPLPSLGVGVLTFIGFFLVIIALFIAMVLVSIPLGVLGLGRLVLTTVVGVLLGTSVLAYLFALILFFLAAAVVGLAAGRFVLRLAGAGRADQPYAALLVGVLIVVILTALPLIGGVLNALVVFVGLGSLALVVWSRRRSVAVRVAPPAVGGAA
jgi:hypothetical protein